MKYLLKEEYRPVMEDIQNEIDKRWERLMARGQNLHVVETVFTFTANQDTNSIVQLFTS